MSYTTQNDLLIHKLQNFYKPSVIEKIIPILNGESQISIRIIDWFVTNYSKQYWVNYRITKGTNTRIFKVYKDYKLNLKAYNKRRFDPFCRWERIEFPYKNDIVIQTTIGQLNFFKWALENKVIDYIEQHYNEIETDMNTRNTTAKKKSLKNNKKTRKKREELSVSAVKSIKKEIVQIEVNFGC